MTTPGPQTLHEMFLDSARRHADRPALEVDGESHSYAQLEAHARILATNLVHARKAGGPKLTGVLGQRSLASFVGILGALASGHGYVPMLPSYPASRVELLIRRSQITELVVDAAGLVHLGEVLAAVEVPLRVFLSDADGPALDQWRRDHARHSFFAAQTAPGGQGSQETPPTTAERDDIAYLLFTSGSTGEPKGVMVAHRNILRFLEVVCERYALTEHDRFSHMFDTTFDLSLFDMFACWRAGGCLCSPDARARLLPAQYVVDQNISVWFSVPSTAVLMKEMRSLGAASLPGLRVSLFCGEALTAQCAQSWAAAAPNSRVENIYGPTELTLACTHYEWSDTSHEACENDIVPIGDPFAGMRAIVVDEKLEPVAPGESGELLMTGPQVAPGYYNDPERTAQSFMVPPGETDIFYRTGDRVRRPVDDDPMIFLGRMDQQIKVNGYRVELGEVEAALRREAGLQSAVALGWPRTASGAKNIVGFIDDASVDTTALIRRLLEVLPRYMVPKQIHVIEEFPLNANGKIDRKALAARLE